MGRLRLFGELVEAGGVAQGSGGGGHQIARIVRTGGDYQTASTSFIDIDGANLAISMTTGESWLLLLLAGSFYVSGMQYGCFDFTVDGQRQGEAKGVQHVQGAYLQDLQIAWLMPVASGSHVIRPQWRVTGGTGVLRASSGETPLLFAVFELQ